MFVSLSHGGSIRFVSPRQLLEVPWVVVVSYVFPHSDWLIHELDSSYGTFIQIKNKAPFERAIDVYLRAQMASTSLLSSRALKAWF